ncbi:response regulator [Butyrivibrio sp. CB08]|uniref:response regulator n=1 Tax=Butyrivibrio sp. CB08 TaxID=2364879 RepID=UPI000EA9F4E5|nr:response regulator [Butyrivibrio sp. CB08]RKM62248.1 response regulator [Butyrivibrio sp. CB08]
MHLAVCDDNIADRKQTERLLGRQSDRIFKETGERIYIDSYGNVDAFMQRPQMYHGLFIDMVDGDTNGFEVLKKLLEVGIVRPIIMCSSSIDYRKLAQEAGLDRDNVFFLEKPLKVSELTAMVDTIKELTGVVIPTIELRGQKETIYAKGDDIICVTRSKPTKSELDVHLTGGRVISIIEDIVNFYDQCQIFPQLCPVNDYGIVNVNHIKKTSFGKVTMDNNVTLKVSFTYRNSIEITRRNLCDIRS